MNAMRLNGFLFSFLGLAGVVLTVPAHDSIGLGISIGMMLVGAVQLSLKKTWNDTP